MVRAITMSGHIGFGTKINRFALNHPRIATAIRKAGHFLSSQLRSEAGVLQIGVSNRECVFSTLKDKGYKPKVICKPSNGIMADQQALLALLRQPGNRKNLAEGEVLFVISPENYKGRILADLKDLQNRGKIKDVKVTYEKLKYIDGRSNVCDLLFDQITEGTVLDDAEYSKSFGPYVFFEPADDEAAAEAERWFQDPRILVFHPKPR
jgi:hypothetical protein